MAQTLFRSKNFELGAGARMFVLAGIICGAVWFGTTIENQTTGTREASTVVIRVDDYYVVVSPRWIVVSGSPMSVERETGMYERSTRRTLLVVGKELASITSSPHRGDPATVVKVRSSGWMEAGEGGQTTRYIKPGGVSLIIVAGAKYVTALEGKLTNDVRMESL